jgi:HicB family
MCGTLKDVKTVKKRNLTLNLPVDLIRDAKVQAAERNMSLNAWIQEAIDHTMRFKRTYIASGEKILEAAGNGALKMPKKKLTRAELYER